MDRFHEGVTDEAHGREVHLNEQSRSLSRTKEGAGGVSMHYEGFKRAITGAYPQEPFRPFRGEGDNHGT